MNLVLMKQLSTLAQLVAKPLNNIWELSQLGVSGLLPVLDSNLSHADEVK